MYYSIREVAAMLAINPSMIRFWEKEFSQLKPHKLGNGERRFTENDIALLKQIQHLLKDKGYTIEGARKALKSDIKSTPPETQLKEIVNKLESIKEKLIEIKNQIP